MSDSFVADTWSYRLNTAMRISQYLLVYFSTQSDERYILPQASVNFQNKWAPDTLTDLPERDNDHA